MHPGESGEAQPLVGSQVPRRTDADLLFLCGFASGGTDLLMEVVGAHRDIFMPGEFPRLASLAGPYADSIPAHDVGRLIGALRTIDNYDNFVHHHWDNFVTDRRDPVELPPLPAPIDGRYTVSTIYQWLLGVPASVVWTGNKTPTNTEHLDKLHVLFPAARYMVITRDPRDTAMSWRRKSGKDELLAASKWNRRMALGTQHLAKLPSERAMWLTFEDLLDDLEGQCRRICAFLDLAWDPDMLRFHETVTKHIPGKPNWARPLVRGNHGKWRTEMDPALVRRVEEITFPTMQHLSYEPSLARGHRPLTRAEALRGRARDAYALLFVGNRYQQRHRLRNRFQQIIFDVSKRVRYRELLR